MKKKSNVKTIGFLNMGCYPGSVLFSHGFSYDELMKEMSKQYKSGRWKKENGYELWKIGIENEKDYSWQAMKRVVENPTKGLEKTLFYIFIPDQFSFSDYDYCRLAHEVLHICQFFLPDVLDRNKEIEAEAYLHTHLMQQCLEIIRGKNER